MPPSSAIISVRRRFVSASSMRRAVERDQHEAGAGVARARCTLSEMSSSLPARAPCCRGQPWRVELGEHLLEPLGVGAAARWPPGRRLALGVAPEHAGELDLGLAADDLVDLGRGGLVERARRRTGTLRSISFATALPRSYSVSVRYFSACLGTTMKQRRQQRDERDGEGAEDRPGEADALGGAATVGTDCTVTFLTQVAQSL